MGYRKTLRILTLFTLILSFGAYGLGHLTSCAQDVALPEAGLEAEPEEGLITEVGSEVLTTTTVSPGENSHNIIELYTQVVGLDNTEGLAAKLIFLAQTNLPGLVGDGPFPVEFNIPVTDGLTENRLMLARAGPDQNLCPAFLIGIAQNEADSPAEAIEFQGLGDRLC